MSKEQPGRNAELAEMAIDEIVEMANPEVKGTSPLKDFDRITASFQMHMENCCDKARTAPCKFSKMLKSQGIQLYDRKIKVKKDWMPFNCSWVAEEGEVGYIVIENSANRNEMRRMQMIEPPEGEEYVPLPSILLKLNGNDEEADIEIEPGEFNFISPKRAHLWRIKSSGVELFAQVYVFPK